MLGEQTYTLALDASGIPSGESAMIPGSVNSTFSSTVEALDAKLQQHYRYPIGIVKLQHTGEARNEGFFRFGAATCFGVCGLPGLPRSFEHSDTDLPDATGLAEVFSGGVGLPFHLSEVADNLRFERHANVVAEKDRKLLNSPWVRRGYYLARKFMPVAVRRHFQRVHLADWRQIPFPKWPVDCSVELMFEQVLRLAIQAHGGMPIPFVWFWPQGYASCMIMTHDIEYAEGRDFCATLMNLDESAGLRSSFQIIPEERYTVPSRFLEEIRRRGHEINIHDLNHDGRLFPERQQFVDRARKIRTYAKEFGADGFRSGVLYRNLEWYDELDFSYDMSVPNVAHLDPQRGGCCTVMPYFIGRVLELPLTTTQDYSLFHILRDYSLCLWEEQISRILAHHGLVSFNIHPDYIAEERALAVYVALLSRLAAARDKHNLWAALPREVSGWWRQRSSMELVRDAGGWRVVGEGSERARVAYATLEGDRLHYRLDS